MSAGYQALHDGAAWLDLSERGKIRLTGEDRARLLHALTTNHIQQLAPGSGCYAFFLNAQGRILGDANVLCREDHFLLDTEPETREKLFTHLDKYIIADDVTPEDTTAQTATVAVEGPAAAAVLRKIGAPAPEADCASETWGTRLVARLSYTGSPGFFVMAPVEEKESLIRELESAGAVAGDAEAFHIVRIENGRPRYGEDLSERLLTGEAGVDRGMHYNKGCYLGQEIVERVRSRGQVHRLLMPVLLDIREAPSPGAKYTIDGGSAAEITSAVWSPSLDKVAALAFIRADLAKPGGVLAFGDVRMEVREMPAGLKPRAS